MRPTADFQCANCRQQFENATYATSDVGKVCDDCATENELQYMRTHDRFTIYGPAKLQPGEYVTTWIGRKLGVIRSVGGVHRWTLPRRSIWGERYYCRIEDTQGKMWGGYVGAGLASNIKRVR